jgi:hypothetical protein
MVFPAVNNSGEVLVSIVNMFGLMLITAGVIAWFKADRFGGRGMVQVIDALGGSMLVGTGWLVVLFGSFV